MNLSLVRKLGWLHVRGGRMLHVAHDHQVPTSSLSSSEPAEYQRRWSAAARKGSLHGEKWVTAKVGDIAIEIVAVKTDKVIGYSYLAGDAAQLHLYRTDPPSHWFAPARCVRASTLSLARRMGTLQKHEFVAGVMAMKFSDAAVVTFSMEVDTEDALKPVSEMFMDAYRFVPREITDEEAKQRGAHLIGAIDAGRKGKMSCLHFQPPKHASEWACTGFQTGLVSEAEWDVFDPWASPN